MIEIRDEFPCFGSTCAASVMGDVPGRGARPAVTFARSFLLDWHERFTRFDSESVQLFRFKNYANGLAPRMCMKRQFFVLAGATRKKIAVEKSPQVSKRARPLARSRPT